MAATIAKAVAPSAIAIVIVWSAAVDKVLGQTEVWEGWWGGTDAVM